MKDLREAGYTSASSQLPSSSEIRSPDSFNIFAKWRPTWSWLLQPKLEGEQ
jgi:hypothetical protein